MKLTLAAAVIALSVVACLVSLSGCKKNQKAIVLQQINQSGMFISHDPLPTGAEVTFELRPSEKDLRNIEVHLQNKMGPEMFSIQQQGGQFQPLSKVAVKSSRIERRISVTQGATILYEANQPIDQGNFRQIAPVLLKSSGWKSPLSTNGGDVEFKVEYLRYWKDDTLGSGWTSVKMDSCKIPVALPAPSGVSARTGASRFKGLDLKIGMAREEVEKKVAAFLDKPDSYSPHGNNLRGGPVEYQDGGGSLKSDT